MPLFSSFGPPPLLYYTNKTARLLKSIFLSTGPLMYPAHTSRTPCDVFWSPYLILAPRPCPQCTTLLSPELPHSFWPYSFLFTTKSVVLYWWNQEQNFTLCIWLFLVPSSLLTQLVVLLQHSSAIDVSVHFHLSYNDASSTLCMVLLNFLQTTRKIYSF